MTAVPTELDQPGCAPPPSMVGRVTLILDAFESRETRLTLEQVSSRTHLPRSTAHRILDQLVRLSWLEHSAFGYALGRRVLRIGGPTDLYFGLRSASAPLIHELQLKTGMVVHLAVLDETDVHYLDKVGGRFADVVPSRVGGRSPAHATGLGKAILASLDPERVDELYAAGYSRQTDAGIASLGRLHDELNRIRHRRGLAFDAGECFAGIHCVAAAIHGPQGPLAALSLVGDDQMAPAKAAPLVLAAARRVSSVLYRG